MWQRVSTPAHVPMVPPYMLKTAYQEHLCLLACEIFLAMRASPPVPEQAIRVNVPGSGPQPQLDEGKHHLPCASVRVTLKRVLHAAQRSPVGSGCSRPSSNLLNNTLGASFSSLSPSLIPLFPGITSQINYLHPSPYLRVSFWMNPN